VVPGYERSLSKVLVSILDITQRKSSEDSLKSSEKKYRDLFDNANDAICIVDADLKFKDINTKILELTGYSKEEILKMSIFDLIPPEQSARSKEEFRKLRKKGHYEKFIGKMVTKSGNMIDVEVNSSAIIEDGKIIGSRDILRDITERKKAEMAIKESEARLTEAQRVAHIGNWEWKPKTNELYWSDENYRIFGLNPDISPSLDTFFNIIHPEDLESVKKNIDDALNKIKSYSLDIRIIKLDGSQGYVHAMAEVDFDEQGNPSRMYGTVEDVTERKKIEEELLIFKLGIERSGEAIFITHIDGKIIYINPSFEKIYGYNKEEALGKKPNILKSGLLPPEAYKSYWDTLLAKKVVSGELINKTRDGRLLNIESSANPILNNEGNIIGFLAIQRDITDRKRAEDALRESEGRLQSILDNSSTVVFLKDLEGRYITVNRRYEELFHVTRQTVIGKSDHDIFPREHADRFRQHDLLALEKGGPFEVEEFVPHDDGLHVYISVKFPLFTAEGKPYAVCGIATDITERKRAEVAIREREERLRQAVRVSQIGIFDHDHRIDTIYWSPEQRRIYGFSPDEPVTLSVFLKHLYPEDSERIAKAVRHAHDPAGDGSFDVEHRIVDRKGSLHWVSTRSSTQFEGEGSSRHPVRTVGAVVDITERKNADEKIEASLKEKEILLREIHHRVKNNMQIISSLLGLTSGNIKDKKYVDMFRESQNRINSMSLIHEKLYRSKDLAKIELNEYIKDLANSNYQSRGVKPGTIVLNINIENVQLGIDRSIPFGLIINELITNSLKYAFPGDRKGEIKVSLHLIDENTFELIVSDNGVGIPYDVDFRKTESLGLRLVTMLVENQLKGKIDLDRSKGTEFNIKFQGK
jgi:PAS domain S-box-containing protein